MKIHRVARALSFFAFGLGLCAVCQSLQAQVQLSDRGTGQIEIRVNGAPFSTYYFGSAYPKPFLAPLRTASGIVVTRRYPLEEVVGESRDHQHHRGLWIGYGEINGINFWENEFKYNSNPPKNFDPSKLGRIVLTHINQVKSGRKQGVIDAAYEWRGPGNSVFLEEHRILTFYAQPDLRTVDVEITLTAKRPVHFADTKEGFFAVRVADSMTEKNGGLITSSDGAHTETSIWGKRAKWVDYDGTADGQKVGIAILDDPKNFNFPTRWHARAYGLFAANPFGVRDFEPSSKAPGGHNMTNGDTLHFLYRVIIHSGDLPKQTIEQAYSDFSR